TVDHDTAEPRRDRGVAHQLTEDRDGRVSVRAHDNDVAGPCQLERFMHHQIVGWSSIDGHRHAAERKRRPLPDSGIHEMETTHRIGDVRGGHAAEPLDYVVAGSRHVRPDAKADLSVLLHAVSVAAGGWTEDGAVHERRLSVRAAYRGGINEADRHEPLFGHLGDRIAWPLASETALFHAAIRHEIHAAARRLVDVHGADAETSRRRDRAIDVLREDSRREAVRRGV